ncbi:replication initiation protein [Deinococcus sp. Marseille-Q6407]|uniref:replication initiation protein n=1 Tax=Deinococcus sp. Marseille-Q6407 TaxID=2969223 RepID=UPI0039658B7D
MCQVYWQPNPRGRIWSIGQDLDHHNGLNVLDGPLPTASTLNILSGHQQPRYLLLDAISYGGRSHRAPQQYLEDIRAALNYVHNADPAYTGLLARGPYHPQHVTRVMSGRIYTLPELGQELPSVPHTTTTRRELLQVAQAVEVESRNCAAFEVLRHVGYRLAREGHLGAELQQQLQHQADQLNRVAWADHPSGPLSPSELRNIVKSIARYINRHHRPGAGTGSPRSRIHSRNRGGALPEAEQLARMRQGQAQSAESRREATRAVIGTAVAQLQTAGERVNRKALAERTGLSLDTLTKNADLWKK